MGERFELRRMVRISDLAKGPFWKTCGMRLGEGDPPDVLLDATPEILQYYGTVHGGALMGMLDAAIAVALNRELPPEKGAVTVEMKISFFKPVSQGTVSGRGRILNRGRSLLTGQGELRNEKGELLAVALGTYRIINQGKQDHSKD
jgi:uncharacterized protein (TIGR00369 family)